MHRNVRNQFYILRGKQCAQNDIMHRKQRNQYDILHRNQYYKLVETRVLRMRYCIVNLEISMTLCIEIREISFTLMHRKKPDKIA